MGQIGAAPIAELHQQVRNVSRFCHMDCLLKLGTIFHRLAANSWSSRTKSEAFVYFYTAPSREAFDICLPDFANLCVNVKKGADLVEAHGPGRDHSEVVPHCPADRSARKRRFHGVCRLSRRPPRCAHDGRRPHLPLPWVGAIEIFRRSHCRNESRSSGPWR